MYKTFYNEKNLKIAYQSLKKGKLTAGIDRISKKHFDKNLENTIEYIVSSIDKKNYKFNPYKEQLKLKGRCKEPRILSLPTIKDKLVLKVLKKVLEENLEIRKNSIVMDDMINDLKKNFLSGKFNYFFTLDLKGYYSTINQEYLIEVVSKSIKCEKVIKLLTDALKNPTLPENIKKEDRYLFIKDKGLPEGISISNGLSDLYLKEFDEEHRDSKEYVVMRYVDDIIVICSDLDAEKIKNDVEISLKSKPFYFKLNQEKANQGYLDEGIDFMGYNFTSSRISVSRKNKVKFESSIERLFNEYRNSKSKKRFKNIELLRFDLDNKIAGVFRSKKVYGWMFYFKYCTDLTLFHKLDWFIVKLIRRFSLEKELLDTNGKYIGKKFIKAYFETKKYPVISKYIFNYENYSIEDKISTLERVLRKKFSIEDEYFASIEFDRLVNGSIRNNEIDMGNRYL